MTERKYEQNQAIARIKDAIFFEILRTCEKKEETLNVLRTIKGIITEMENKILD